MPQPLRSSSKPMGLPNLSDKDNEKLRIGNLLFHFTMRACMYLCKSGKLATIENPQISILWCCQRTRELQNLGGIVVIHYCAFGERWKKATSLLHLNFPLLQTMSSYKCQGKHGICSHTNKPHLVLSGVSSSGCFWSRIAQSYPRRFCTAYAKLFQQQAEARALVYARDILS